MLNSVQVVGDVMLDVYEHVTDVRVSNEASAFASRLESVTYALGGAGNAARNCKVIGSPMVRLSGGVGTDDEAEQLLSLCEMEGIATEGVQPFEGYPTITKRRTVDQDGRLLIRVDTTTTPGSGIFNVPLVDYAYKTLLISDYAHGFLTPSNIRGLIAGAIASGMFVAVNGKPQHIPFYDGANVLVLNRRELTESLNYLLPRQDVFSATGSQIHQLMTRINVEHLVVTNGYRPVVHLHKGASQAQKIEVFPLRQVDPTGAGDTFSATLAVLGRVDGDSIAEAIRLSGQVVQQHGTAVPTP